MTNPIHDNNTSNQIHLHEYMSESDTYTLTSNDFDLPSSMSLYLKDTETGSVTEIRDGFEYSFTIAADAAKEARPDLSLTCSNEPKKVSTVSDTRFLIVNEADRKSTRLNSSHVAISYAVFCLKKK